MTAIGSLWLKIFNTISMAVWRGYYRFRSMSTAPELSIPFMVSPMLE